MSEHFFGVGRGKIPEPLRSKIEAAIADTEATFSNPTLPDGPRFWFAVPNRGEPFDSTAERETFEALEKAGIEWPLGRTNR